MLNVTPLLLPPGISQRPQLAPTVSGMSAMPSALGTRVAQSEQTIIEEALRRNQFKRTLVAQELGISRVTLYNKMKKYDLLTKTPRSTGPRSGSDSGTSLARSKAS